MGLFDDLGKLITPHAEKMNHTIATASVLIHGRLEAIERAVSDEGKPGFGNQWFRIKISGNFKTGNLTNFLGVVPTNEIWTVEWVSFNGVKTKGPAFTIVTNGSIIALSYAKEATINESPGGDLVFLPGEELFLVVAAEGEIEGTIAIIRNRIPTRPLRQQSGKNPEKLESRNTHDPDRDIITSPNGIYGETPPEVVSVDPTVP